MLIKIKDDTAVFLEGSSKLHIIEDGREITITISRDTEPERLERRATYQRLFFRGLSELLGRERASDDYCRDFRIIP